MRALLMSLLLPFACSSCLICVPPAFLAFEAGEKDTPRTPIGTPAVRHFSVGVGRLDRGSEWRPVDSMTAASMDGDVRGEELPIWLSSYFCAGETKRVPDSTGLDSGNTELFDFGLGGRHYQAVWLLEPFVGAGAVLGRRWMSDPAGMEQRHTIGGLYGEIGLRVTLTQFLQIGATWRGTLTEDKTFYGQDLPGESSFVMLELVYRH